MPFLPCGAPTPNPTMLALLTSPEAWIALATLTALELVLGIDNIIFISILVDKLPRATQERARRIGLFMAASHALYALYVNVQGAD